MPRILSLAAGMGLFGCLPADTRPEPASVNVTAQLATALTVPTSEPRTLTWTTSDGWVTTLERLLVSIGRVRFRADSCNEYGEANYGRIIDLLQPGRQKVGLLWGLNDCRLAYSVFRPNSDAVLGVSVTTEDHRFMQNAFVPTSSAEGVTQKQGMALYVQGKAEQAGVSVTFEWGFADGIEWTECKRQVDGTLEDSFRLGSGDTLDIGIAIDPTALFLVTPEDSLGASTANAASGSAARSLMQSIVDADQVHGDANGRVSIDELLATSVPSETLAPNLAELIRQRTYPSMFRYDGSGHCDLDTERRRGRGM